LQLVFGKIDIVNSVILFNDKLSLKEVEKMEKKYAEEL